MLSMEELGYLIWMDSQENQEHYRDNEETKSDYQENPGHTQRIIYMDPDDS